MTKPNSSAVRCDQIISLIDECLRTVAGDGHATTPTRTPNRRDAFIRS